jgi:hypothetical protein
MTFRDDLRPSSHSFARNLPSAVGGPQRIQRKADGGPLNAAG